ncbi:MAG TPA: type II toxin-antitoxin system RelE/ParE family toxin [Thermoanaerobaculia bacterium]|nr:type II toxin-antitoxin system RelE/ParE family toxin [Thermoanaerobaculia bacterium]
MAYEVEWAESAVESLVDAIEYIARDSPSYAAAFAVRAERMAASLDMFPERGRRVPEFNDPSVHELPVGSYRLIYRVGANRVLLLAFVHKSRDLTIVLDDDAQ